MRLDSPWGSLKVTRRGRALVPQGARTSPVELRGQGAVDEGTMAWLEQPMADLRADARRACSDDDPVQRARVVAMAERATHG